MNQKEKLSPIELSNINDKLLKLIEEKNLLKMMSKKLVKRFFYVMGAVFMSLNVMLTVILIMKNQRKVILSKT